jgi:O-antigen/teichoic acid export membrane protein
VSLLTEPSRKRPATDLGVFVTNLGHGGIRGLVFMANTLVLVPLVMSSLGQERFALLALVTPFLRYGFNGVFDFGVATGVVRHTSRSFAASDSTRTNEYVSSSLASYVGFGGTLICLYYLLRTPLLSILVHNDIALYGSAQIVFERGVWIYVLFSLSNPFFAVLMGAQRVDATHWIGTTSLLIELCGILLLVPFGLTLARVMWVYAVNGAISLLLGTLLAWHYFPKLRLRWRYVSAGRLKEILGYGAQFSATTFATLFSPVIDKVILARLAGLTTVALYEAAARLIDLLRRATQLLLLPLFPMAGAREQTHSESEKNAFYVQAFSANLLVSCGLYLIPASIAFGIFRAWLGPDSRPAAIAFSVLAGVVFCQAVVGPICMVFLGTGRLKPLMTAALASLFVNLTVSPILARYLGLAGVLLGTMLAFGLVPMLFLVWSLGIPEFAIPRRRLVLLAGPAILAALSPGYVLTSILRLREQPVGWLKLFIAAAIAGGAFLGALLTQVGARRMAFRVFVEVRQTAMFMWTRRHLSKA